jgi:hypothetical protein
VWIGFEVLGRSEIRDGGNGARKMRGKGGGGGI